MASNQLIPQSGTTFAESRGFEGLDLWHDPQDLTGNFLLQADNLVNRAGVLYSRPGKMGQFTTPFTPFSSSASSISSGTLPVVTNSLFGLDNYVDSDGISWLLFTVEGKIYKAKRGASAYTELLDVDAHSFAFSSPLVREARYGQYAYLVDGHHNLVRIDLNGGVPLYSMNAPTDIPPASLTRQLLAQSNLASSWSFDGATSTYNISPGYQASAGQFNTTAWVQTNIDTSAPPYLNYLPTLNTGPQAYLSGGSAPYGGVIVNPAYSGNANLHPKRFHILMSYAKDTDNQYGVDVQVRAYAATDGNEGSFLAAITNGINPAANSTGQFDSVYDFTGIPVEILAIKVIVAGQQQNDSLKSGNLWVNDLAIYPLVVLPAIVSGPTNGGVVIIPSEAGGAVFPSSSSAAPTSSSSPSSASSASSSSAFNPSYTPPASDLGNTLDFINTSLTFTIPIPASSSSSPGPSSSPAPFGIDLSRISRIMFSLGGAASWVGLSVVTYLYDAISATWVLADNGTTITTDNTAMVTDISTIDPTLRRAVSQVRITFTSSPEWVAPFNALQVGPFFTPGNLSIGLADYTYYVTEIDKLGGTQGQIESDPSPPSNAITPLLTLAEGVLSLPNSYPANSVTTDYGIYRLGGSSSDAVLVTTVPRNADVAYGSDPANPYYSWNHTTKVFTDNTPDLWLIGAPVLVRGREPAPANAQAIAAWGGRLWLAMGNNLYASWLFDSDNSAALYFTLAPSPSDPNITIEGTSLIIGNDTSDTIQALIPFGTPIAAGNQFGGGLLVLSKRSVWLVQGTSPADYTVRQYDYSEGVGLIAPRGWARITSGEVIFMGPDRLHVFPPKNDSGQNDIGLMIQPQLYPVVPETLQDPVAFANSAMLYHDSKLYLFTCQPGQTSNTIAWVWDMRMHGWTRLLQQNVTSALSLPPGGTTGADYELYTFGLDGQMYLMTGNADYATPTSSAVPISWTVMVHGMRPAFYYRMKPHPLYYRNARLVYTRVEASLTGDLTLTAQGYNPTAADPYNADPGATYSFTYTWPGVDAGWERSMPGGQVRGQYITVTLSASTTDQAYIRGVRGGIAETGIRR